MPDGYLPEFLLLICNILAVVVCLLAIWRTELRFWSGYSEGLQVGVVFIALCGLYMLQADIKPGMAVHWLGVMVSVLMLGPWTAIVVLASVHIFLLAAFSIGGVDTLGFNITVCVLLPVMVATAFHMLIYYRLPRIVPVYFAETGFGDLFCMLSVDLVLTICLLTWFDYPNFIIQQDFTLLLALIGGMEALISTWIISLLVCFFPNWLNTFSDEEYLHGK